MPAMLTHITNRDIHNLQLAAPCAYQHDVPYAAHGTAGT